MEDSEEVVPPNEQDNVEESAAEDLDNQDQARPQVVFHSEDQPVKKKGEDNPVDDYNLDEWSEDEEDHDDSSAVPMERLKNGAANALKFWQWGIQQVTEQAEELKKNENVKQASEKWDQVYEQMKPGLDRVREGAEVVGGKIKEGATVVYEKSKPTIDELAERSKPKLDELSKSASETWEVAKEKAVLVTEACKPGLERAAESTRNIVFNNNDPAQQQDASGTSPFSEI